MCRTSANQALARAGGDIRVEASLYAIIARSYELDDHLDEARTYFAMALTVLETTADPAAVARTQANLAAARLKPEQTGEAQRLLQQATPVLTSLGDKAGHATALPNQRLADIYITR